MAVEREGVAENRRARRLRYGGGGLGRLRGAQARSTAKVTPARRASRSVNLTPNAAAGVVTPPGTPALSSISASALSVIIFDVEP